MKIKELIKARLKKEWSQEKLAEISGISATYINEIERGKRPRVSLKVITDLCKCLEIPVSVIAGDMSPQEWEDCQDFLKMLRKKRSDS